MLGREGKALAVPARGGKRHCREQKNMTTEANILMKTKGQNFKFGNEAKK